MFVHNEFLHCLKNRMLKTLKDYCTVDCSPGDTYMLSRNVGIKTPLLVLVSALPLILLLLLNINAEHSCCYPIRKKSLYAYFIGSLTSELGISDWHSYMGGWGISGSSLEELFTHNMKFSNIWGNVFKSAYWPMSMQNGQYVGNVISICKCLQDESIKGNFHSLISTIYSRMYKEKGIVCKRRWNKSKSE